MPDARVRSHKVTLPLTPITADDLRIRIMLDAIRVVESVNEAWPAARCTDGDAARLRAAMAYDEACDRAWRTVTSGEEMPIALIALLAQVLPDDLESLASDDRVAVDRLWQADAILAGNDRGFATAEIDAIGGMNEIAQGAYAVALIRCLTSLGLACVES